VVGFAVSHPNVGVIYMIQVKETLADLIAWLRTKPAEEEYNYANPSDCALAQFFKARGYRLRGLSCNDFDVVGGKSYEFPLEWVALANYIVPYRVPRTFGKMLENALEL
jgi:hypothetical protein